MANSEASKGGWSLAEIVERLRSTTAPGEDASAHVFLSDPGDKADLRSTAQHIVEAAAASAGVDAAAPTVGSVSRLARSFSVTATPEVFAALAREPSVKAILPSQLDDIYPKPVKIQEE